MENRLFMKLLYNFLKSYAITLIFLGLLSLVVWFRGPEIYWHNIAPLQGEEQRFCIIIVIWLAWLLKFIFIDINQHTKTLSSNLPPEAKNKLERLQGRFEGAIEFLTKTVITQQGKNVNLLRLPWFLVIGPKSAGKSTLLANANINFILSKNFKPGNSKTITQSDMCDWWVTRDLVLVDIPGAYLASKTRNSPLSHAIYHFLWRHLLKLIQTCHQKNPIQGVVVALNLPEIFKFHRQQKTQVVHDLKKRLNELLEQFDKQLPIHLVITKCDLIPGFSEFFSEYSIDEITQSWGVTLPPRHMNESLLDAFTTRFNVLIKRLNKQLISRLHQERNTAAKPYIKDFPLHIERLKEGITQFIKALGLPQLALQGVYLTSGTQEIEKEQTTFTPFIPGVQTGFDNQTLQIMSTPPMPARAYFIRQLILSQLLVNPFSHDTKKINKPNWQRRAVYASSIGAVIVAGTLLGHDFYKGLHQHTIIQAYLADYQTRIQKSNQKGDFLIQTLPLLNALQQAQQNSFDTFFISFYSKKSQQTTDMVYEQALQTIVIPEIKKYFESYLKAAQNDPEKIYPVLKAYLMLGDKEHYQADYVTRTLLQLMPNTTDKEAIAALSNHIHNALNKTPLAVKLDAHLIDQTRKLLFNLPITTLGFVVLKNDPALTQTAVDLRAHFNASSIFTNAVVTSTIPFMYTAKGYQQITNIEINRITTEVLQGNWILGFNATSPTTLAAEELAGQLHNQYIANYIDMWERLLANTQLNTPQNLPQMNHLITTLISNNSPLLVLLDLFKQNTSLTPIMTGSPRLQNLSVLLTDATANQPGGLYGIFVGLRQLQSYVAAMTNTTDLNKAIFEATAKRIQDPTKDPLTQIRAIAETSPEPMKTWLKHMADQTWHLMIKDTSAYIEKTWQQNIMLNYHTFIENRYPFNQTATIEVDLQQFTNLLGQTGQLANFYQVYLKPFVIETKQKREWRMVDNEKLAFSDAIFETYQHLASIQRAFFPNGDNKLYVPFTLQPVSLDKSIKSFTLNINGQELRYQKNMPRLISWPGNHNIRVTSVNFVTPHNQLISNTIKGDWGWFRLVTQATGMVRSRKEIALNFEMEGRTASYILFTQGSLNPFLPMNLTKFSLSEKL